MKRNQTKPDAQASDLPPPSLARRAQKRARILIAMLHAEEICNASERLAVLVMGTNDLAKELRASHVPGRQPLLSGLDKSTKRGEAFGDNRPVVFGVIGLMSGWWMTVIATVSLVCVLIFRRGLLFHILGIAVVTSDGADASRLRLLWRGLIVWSPVLISTLLLSLSMYGTPARLVVPSVLLGMLVLGLAIASLIPKKRGLQDMMAGTWLVPR